MTERRLLEIEMMVQMHGGTTASRRSMAIMELIEAIREMRKVRERRRRDPKKPTLREAMVYGEEIGMPDGMAEAFFDSYEKVGWVYGRHRLSIVDWKAAQRDYKRREEKWRPQQGRATHGVG